MIEKCPERSLRDLVLPILFFWSIALRLFGHRRVLPDLEIVTVAMSKAVPMTGNPAKKRAHDDHDEDEPLATSYLPPKTPTVSPTNATQGAGMASIQQLGNDRMDLETQMHGKFTEAPTAKLPDTTKSDSHVKRARLLPNNTTLTGPTNAASLSSPAEGAKDSELTCRGSDHSCMGLPSSTSTGWTAELRRLDGNGGGEPHSPPSDPSSGETTTSSSSDPHQASDSNDAFNPAENMEID